MEQNTLALITLERSILQALADVPYTGWCRGLRPVSEQTGIPSEVCRSVIRGLVDQGLAEVHRGLWAEDGEPAGYGYCITSAGSRLILPDHLDLINYPKGRP